MSATTVSALKALRRRWNAQAYDLVNDELARVATELDALRAENDALRTRLAWAEDCTEHWREEALEALNRDADALGVSPGLTINGRLVLCLPQGVPA